MSMETNFVLVCIAWFDIGVIAASIVALHGMHKDDTKLNIQGDYAFVHTLGALIVAVLMLSACACLWIGKTFL